MNPFLGPVVARPASEPWCAPVKTTNISPSCRLRAAGVRHAVWLRLLAGLSCLSIHTWVIAVDVNTATVLELESVQGIGPKTAQVIIKERDRAGYYRSLKDLSERVKGIGPKKAARLAAAGLTASAAYGASIRSGNVAPGLALPGSTGLPVLADPVEPAPVQSQPVQEKFRGYFRR